VMAKDRAFMQLNNRLMAKDSVFIGSPRYFV